jgi:hypothetical protein
MLSYVATGRNDTLLFYVKVGNEARWNGKARFLLVTLRTNENNSWHPFVTAGEIAMGLAASHDNLLSDI